MLNQKSRFHCDGPPCGRAASADLQSLSARNGNPDDFVLLIEAKVPSRRLCLIRIKDAAIGNNTVTDSIETLAIQVIQQVCKFYINRQCVPEARKPDAQFSRWRQSLLDVMEVEATDDTFHHPLHPRTIQINRSVSWIEIRKHVFRNPDLLVDTKLVYHLYDDWKVVWVDA